MRKIKVIIADDHPIFRKGLSDVLNSAPDIKVTGEAQNGEEAIALISKGVSCDILLLDVNMPVLNGIQTMTKLNRLGFTLPVLILSMDENQANIIHLLKLGVRGYVLKDIPPDELLNSVREVMSNRYILNGVLSPKLSQALENQKNFHNSIFRQLSERELEFLRLAPSDLAYHEIATTMNVATRTVDFYRDSLFSKLNVKSRIGLALFAIKWGLFKV
jgi:DNA-binding NarL/FixJ family response regulator